MAEPALKRDKETVKPDGKEVTKLPHGVSFYESKTHVDDRGTLCEMFNPSWGWHKVPLKYAYFITIRPGKVKGWAVHRHHEDRYFIMFGDLELVLYDSRKNSPTYKKVFKIYLSEKNRRAINIPAGVYHAIQNIDDRDVILANFPTKLFDYKNPDKYRLPYNTKEIPHNFDAPRGW